MPKIIRLRSDVDRAIEISQINARLDELREEERQLKARREFLVSKLKRKYKAFQFRDAYSRLFELILSPRSREQVDLDLVRIRYERLEEDVPMKKVKWVEVNVSEVQEGF